MPVHLGNQGFVPLKRALQHPNLVAFDDSSLIFITWSSSPTNELISVFSSLESGMNFFLPVSV